LLENRIANSIDFGSLDKRRISYSLRLAPGTGDRGWAAKIVSPPVTHGQELRVKKRTWVALILMTLYPTLGWAQKSFDGIWKVDVGSLPFSNDTLVWSLGAGVYQCKSCVPPIEVAADAQDQPTPGQPYDTIRVGVIDERTVELIERKDGRVVSDETFRISADGNAVTDEFLNWKVTMIRVAPAPPGSHALSGSWRPVKRESVSDNALLLIYRVKGQSFTMTRPTGESFAAKLDGKVVAYRGNPGISGVSLKRIGAHTVEQTNELDGRPITVLRMSVGGGGKSMTVLVTDVTTQTTIQFTAHKQ
jgi:hypothetical protein